MLVTTPPRYRTSYLSPYDVPRLQVTSHRESVDREVGKGHEIGFDIGEACKERDARRDSERWNRLGRGTANRGPEQEPQGDPEERLFSTGGFAAIMPVPTKAHSLENYGFAGHFSSSHLRLVNNVCCEDADHLFACFTYHRHTAVIPLAL